MKATNNENSNNIDTNINNKNVQNNSNTKIFNSNDFYSGLVAGIVSRTLTAPLERVKILNQVGIYIKDGHTKYKHVGKAMRTILKEEGVSGLFRGNLVNILKAGPQSAIRFYSYGAFKRMVQQADGSISLINRVWAGASAGVVSVALTHPLDVIKTHISIKHTSSEILQVTKSIYKQDGVFGFFRGLSAGILNIAPFAGLNFTFYELIKEKTESILKTPPIYFPSIYGAFSGAITMTILYPLDVVKRRIMLQHYYKEESSKIYRNFIDALIKIAKNEGIGSLYKGIKPAYFKVIPTVSINFLIYEGTLNIFDSNKKK
ncbi:hypothetical protein DICPUDRAFT_76529 [Dictyostelium purpureum]|uniref:Mitochondrial substrate carrier family protein n=1 Tax=Dictyostelium purpureum TaxID=5786 RepID=F0ZDW4_DICPU|nr:uncharacterized protein DICPUDRAFT_76529 [Dictyostelium purpureum]EGC37872.1 hypothetical protein DICPUDRAFT_76529 [Dictyostelium purpureum]|eukprot:XP_003285622.1 hypothetical protein DICPUDRAFT_76529 [Dictyostelium purpureum]